MTVAEKLEKLRRQMEKKGIDAYIVCTDDFHGSEYVGEYFKVREFLSGFTGSAGTLVILMSEAALWTDGRYFIQAESQLAGSKIKLMKMNIEGVPSIEEYLAEKLDKGNRIGFDGRTVSYGFIALINEKLKHKNIEYCYEEDLVADIWENRPQLPKEKVFELDTRYTGEKRADKLLKLRESMKKETADLFITTALDEIAWILNLRGNDIKYCPLFLSYMIVEKERVKLFVDREKIDEAIIENLKKDGVSLYEYDDFYNCLGKISATETILLDMQAVNYKALRSVNNEVAIVDTASPVQLMKAVKSKAEYENIRVAHIKDGVAMTRFMYWLKNNAGKIEITEISAAEKIQEYRRKMAGYIEESFEPIVAYKEHGAIVHYQATKETDAEIKKEGILLVDTGGHYINGTTDITRTFVLGEISEEAKKNFTYVLMGHLNLCSAKFLYGTRGINLDYIAREPLWKIGKDYNHGTGHGVGYLLNVHEGPNSFRWRLGNRVSQNPVLEEGMVTSDEPGLYIEGEYGIRHENMILCLKDLKNEYGQFMKFEILTKVPFDVDGIDISVMSREQVEILNEYHKEVYDTISEYLDKDEREWLEKVTRPIG